MKTVWIAAILLLVVLVGAIALHVYTTSLYDRLQQNFQRLERAVESEDWEAARRESGELQEIWERTDASWTPIMDHRQVDHLDESLTRVFKLLELQNRKDLLLELAVAARSAKRIKDTDIPMLRNIF